MRRPSPAVWLLIALVLGLAAGIVAGSDPALAGNLVRVLQPIGTLWLNAIRMTVVPLVVATVLAALLGSGAEHLVRRIGGRALVLLIGMLLVASAFTVLVAPPVLSALMPPADASTLAMGGDAPQTTSVSFIAWLLDLIPVNPVRAAAETAMLPLLVFVVFFGLAAARLPWEQRSLIYRAAAAISAATLVLVRWVLLVAPVGVFALAAVLGTRLGASAAGAVIVYVAVVTVLCILVAAGLYVFVALSTRYPVREFARASAPAQAVALSARSSLASLPAMIEGAARMGMRPGVGSFFLPLAASVFRLGGVVGITTGILFLAHLYGVRIGAAELATIFVAVPLLTFSVPGIPGGSILIMSPVLVSVGVPIEGIGILLATDTIPDMVRTAVNVTADMAAATALDAHLPTDTEIEA
ncbi:MAG TPA: cation:dicarboxylase symporter family transporter [Gemmatimonadaceae bacterium]